MSQLRTGFFAALVAFGAASLQAQEITVETLDDPVEESDVFVTEEPSGVFLREASLFEEITEEVRAVKGLGADIRALDKTTGEVRDITLSDNETARFGYLSIGLAECRHPDDNAAGEAYAYLTITEEAAPSDPLFQGWMIASSPALNAMDHARFDVWILRCQVAADAASTEATSGN